jgi:hypothetical protein
MLRSQSRTHTTCPRNTEHADRSLAQLPSSDQQFLPHLPHNVSAQDEWNHENGQPLILRDSQVGDFMPRISK